MRHCIIVAALILAGCASNSGVVQMGPNSYFVSRQAATGLSGLGSLKAEAMAEAGQHCTAQGKTVDITDENDTKPPYIFGRYPRTEIRFRCI